MTFSTASKNHPPKNQRRGRKNRRRFPTTARCSPSAAAAIASCRRPPSGGPVRSGQKPSATPAEFGTNPAVSYRNTARPAAPPSSATSTPTAIARSSRCAGRRRSPVQNPVCWRFRAFEKPEGKKKKVVKIGRKKKPGS